jgi:hypothetical protein
MIAAVKLPRGARQGPAHPVGTPPARPRRGRVPPQMVVCRVVISPTVRAVDSLAGRVEVVELEEPGEIPWFDGAKARRRQIDAVAIAPEMLVGMVVLAPHRAQRVLEGARNVRFPHVPIGLTARIARAAHFEVTVGRVLPGVPEVARATVSPRATSHAVVPRTREVRRQVGVPLTGHRRPRRRVVRRETRSRCRVVAARSSPRIARIASLETALSTGRRHVATSRAVRPLRLGGR